MTENSLGCQRGRWEGGMGLNLVKDIEFLWGVGRESKCEVSVGKRSEMHPSS